jgi:phosphopantetheine--protein transferase-like protein
VSVIGVGIDVVDVDRLRRTLARTPSLVDRLFTPAERAYASRLRDPTERFAARFAAKEAVMKALGVGLGAFAFHDVEVQRATSGAPSLVLRGSADALAADQGVREWKVSLSHTAHVAEAVVIALGETAPTCTDT